MVLEKNSQFIKELMKVMNDFDNFKLIIKKDYLFRFNKIYFNQMREITVPEILTFKIEENDFNGMLQNNVDFDFENRLIKYDFATKALIKMGDVI